MKRVLGALALCAMIATGVLIALGTSHRTALVRKGPLQDRLVLRAIVVAARGVTEVAAGTEPRALRVLVREGDRVSAGQTLAELDPGSIGAAVLLTAPVGGTVLARRLDPGDSVSVASQGGTRALFEIADESATEVRAEVEERDASRLRAGLDVRLTTPGARSVVGAGTIARIAARLEPRTIGADDARVRADGNVRALWIAWRGKPPALLLGQELEANVALAPRPPALRVPRSAVVVREGRTVVETPGWFGSRQVPVVVKAADDAVVEITGVAEGTRVVLH